MILDLLLFEPQHRVLFYWLLTPFPVHLYHSPSWCGGAIGQTVRHLGVRILSAMRTWSWRSRGGWIFMIVGVLRFKFGFLLVKGGLVGFVAMEGRSAYWEDREGLNGPVVTVVISPKV